MRLFTQVWPLVRLRWFVRSRPVLWWCIAGLMSSVAAVSWYQQVAELSRQRRQLGTTVAVVVADRDLLPGSMLDQRVSHIEQRPQAFVSADAVHRLATERVVVHPIAAGEPVVAARLAPEQARGIGALIGRGERAIAVPVDGRTPSLLVGDWVDVLGNLGRGEFGGDGRSTLLAASARVVHRDERIVMVAVTAESTPSVATAVAGGAVTLAVTAGPSPPE